MLLWNNRRGTATTRGPGELTWFHCCGPQKLACSILYLRCIQCHTVDKTLDAPKINNRTSSILWAWAQLIASISNPPSSLTLNCIIIIITTWQMLLLGCCSLLPLSLCDCVCSKTQTSVSPCHFILLLYGMNSSSQQSITT